MNAIEHGICLFNAQSFWHAHEAWERDWLVAADPHKQFLQGLIQLAAAYHHVQRGTFSGGVRLFDSALKRLEGFPPGYGGVDRAEAVAKAVQHRGRIALGDGIDPGEFPKLRYNS
jgi:predicted metal-dependent hydrolase